MSKNSYLFVFPTATLGGAERVMFNIVYYLLMREEHVVVFIMSRGKQKGWEDIEHHKNLEMIICDYPSERKAMFPLILRLIYLSLNNKFKFIFSSHIHINAIISMLKKNGFFKGSYLISRESTVIFERDFGNIKYLFLFFYHYMYGQQDLLICQTQKMQDSLIKKLGFIPAKKIEVIPNPVNIQYIDDNLSGIIVKENLIVACGRFIELKQFDLLIEVFYKCCEEFPSYKLVLIGDGNERDKLREKVELFGLKEKVIFTGKISNPFQWFAKAKIGIVSSKIEGFPNVLLEMMASKVNMIISTPCADGIELLPNINITQDTSIYSIEVALRHALMGNYDYSEIYRSYIIEQRSIKSFMDKIENVIGNDLV